jgi:ribose transport system substrate-binding protein
MKGKMFLLVLLLGIVVAGMLMAGGKQESSGDGMLQFEIVAKGVHPWFDPAAEGFERAAKEIGGININYSAPAEWTGEAQAAMMENLIARKVDGIALSVVDAGAMTQVINEAMGRGIPVVTWDDTALDSDQIIYIGTDNYSAGYTQGHYIADLTGGKGNYIIWVQDLTWPNLKERTRGLREAFAKYPDMKEVADVQLAGVDPAQGIVAAEGLLQAYPQIDVTAECGMYGAIGMYQMMKDRGMDKDSITNVAWTTLPEIVDGIKEGYIKASVRQNPYGMGYLSAYALSWYIEGKRPSQKTFDSGVVLATAENVDTVDDASIAGAPALLEDFKKIWK